MDDIQDKASFFDVRQKEAFQEQAEVLGHAVSYIGSTMLDQRSCSCGYVGDPFFDGNDLSWVQWRDHVLSETSGVG